jgi:hypothetical protein
MAATGTAEFERMMKIWYEQKRVKLRAYPKNPTLALLPKAEDFRGKQRNIPIWFATGQGVSATFSVAQSRKGSGQYRQWELTRVKGYGLGALENEVIEASKGDKAAFMSATAEIDGVMHQVTRDIASAIFRDRNGSRATIGSLATTTSTNDTVVLANRSDITGFEVGMYLVRTTAGTAASYTTEVYRVRAVDRQLGRLVMETTTGANVNLGTTGGVNPAAVWAPGHHLHREGDINGSSDTLKLAGFDSWLPVSVTPGESHFSVDRSVDRERLAGVYVDGSSMSVEDALIEGAAHLHEVGANPDLVIMGPMQLKQLTRELGSKVTHDIVKSPDMAKIGFESVKIHTPAGKLDVISDQNCQGDRAYMLTKDTWKLYSLGACPRVLTYGPGDGNRWLRESDEDAVEYRIGWYGQLGCHAPGHNARILLAS